MAYTSRGMLRRVRGDRAGGMADLEKAIESDPRNPSAWANRGMARKQDGKVEGAITDLEKALELAPAGWSQRERLKRELEELKRR